MSKEDSKMIQGLSVLAMVCLHLFDTIDYENLFTPLLFFKGYPLAFYFAQLSDFCVMGFAFCSGYAHMKLYESKNYYKKRLVGLLSLYCNFWIILILFTIASVISGYSSFMPGSAWSFFKAFTTVSMEYNDAWWYLPVYAVIVFISPLILKASKKMNSAIVLALSFIIYCGGYLLRYKFGTPYKAINWFGPFAMTLFEYMIGVVCCKTQFFEKIEKRLANVKPGWIYLFCALAFVAMLLGHTLIFRSMIIAPFSGFVIICIAKFCNKQSVVKKVLIYFGNHSTNIWLTHMFFCFSLFKGLVFTAKYPIPIYLMMIAICLAVSYIINLIFKPIQKQIKKLS